MKPKSLQKLPWRLPDFIDSSRNNQSDGRRLRTWTLKLKQSRMQTISWLTIWCEGIEEDNHSIQGICVVSSIFTSQNKYVFSWIYVSVRASAKTTNYEFWCLIAIKEYGLPLPPLLLADCHVVCLLDFYIYTNKYPNDVLSSWADQGSCAHKCVLIFFRTVTRNAVNKSV